MPNALSRAALALFFATLLALLADPSSAQTYRDTNGTIVPGVVPLNCPSGGGVCLGVAGNTPPLTLLSNASATSQTFTNVFGGSYAYSCVGTWNGATAALQYLAPDGATWIPLISQTANTTSSNGSVILGNGSSIRVQITGGPPSAVYCGLTPTLVANANAPVGGAYNPSSPPVTTGVVIGLGLTGVITPGGML